MKGSIITSVMCCFVLLFTANSKAQNSSNMPTGRKFFIQSALNYGKNNGGYWDVPGTPTTIVKGLNIQLWDMDGGIDRQFSLSTSMMKGFYEIKVGNVRVNIDGGKANNGTNVEVWDKDGTPKQMFCFRHLGEGRFKIFGRNGKAVCAAGRNSVNGANVHIWDDHDGPWMEWYLIDAQTKQVFIPQDGSATKPNTSTSAEANTNDLNPSILYRFEEAEDMVYGKVGLFDDGRVKYTFAVIRKSNKTKQVYVPEFDDPYAPRPIPGSGVMRVNNNPKDYDQYDYWVVFNGQKMGPYDRIYEMHQDNPDVDKWVSTDGKSISFSAVKGQQYAAIIGNKQVTSFWNFGQAPSYDPTFGRSTFAMQWAKDDTRLYEDGKLVHKDWKRIDNVCYSASGKDLLYVGAETNSDERYVYLNHKQVAGPYDLISWVGFVPGTDKPYIVGVDYQAVNGRAVYNYGNVQIGDRKISIPDEHSVGPFKFAGPWVSFFVDKTNDTYKGSDVFKKKSIWIYEYNHVTDELIKHEGYAHAIKTDIINETFYYSTFNANGDELLVKQGGKVLCQMSGKVRGEGVIFFSVSKSDDVLVYYNTKFMGPYTVQLNGKPFTQAGNQVMELGLSTRFCPETGKLRMHIRKDRSLDGIKNRFINGDSSFDFEGRVSDLSVIYCSQSDDIYFQTITFDADKNHLFQLHKNGKPIVDGQWYAASALQVAPDGRRFAMLASDSKSSRTFTSYNTLNQNMNFKRTLVVDGVKIGDNYGAPVWSSARQKFLALQATDGIIKMVEL